LNAGLVLHVPLLFQVLLGLLILELLRFLGRGSLLLQEF
jgi:hypothetical protein